MEPGTTFGHGAGLVDDEGVDPGERFERLGVADEHAGPRAPADADHDRHGGRQPQRAGTGDDEHRHRATSA